MDYLRQIREHHITKETKKVCIFYVSKETKETKEVENVTESQKSATKKPLKKGSDTLIELAITPDGTALSPVYWESMATGCLLGPVTPEFVALADDQVWIITTFEGEARWIRGDLLRTGPTDTPVRRLGDKC
jgi:hypothetical protein